MREKRLNARSLARGARREISALTESADRIAQLERSLRELDRERHRLHRHIHRLEQILRETRNSLSWKITKPLRAAVFLSRRLRQIALAWLLFKPDTRPRRALDHILDLIFAERRRRAAEEAALQALRAVPKRQVRYILVGLDEASSAGTLNEPVRQVWRAYAETAHDVRLVRWNADLRACVLVDAVDDLSDDDASRRTGDRLPPPAEAPTALRILPGSGSWLVSVGDVAAFSPVLLDPLMDWAKDAGLKTGFMVHGGGEEPMSLEMAQWLTRADRVWPVSTAVEQHIVSAWADQHLAKPPVHVVTLPGPGSKTEKGSGLDCAWSDVVTKIEASGPGGYPLIYYWVDTTIVVPVNTGIQRVVRQMARGLIEAGFRLVPVKWGDDDQPLAPVSHEALEHFARWNGPAIDQWHGWTPAVAHSGGGCFIMNELPHNLTSAQQAAFRSVAEAAGLKTAAVFYDAIPWKMAHLYPENFSTAHMTYMAELSRYAKVLAISEYSRAELVKTLGEELQIPESALRHIVACPLAAEFPEAGEIALLPPRQDGAIEILCLGTVEPRKNHERLLTAFELASQRSAKPLHLTIIGGGHSFEPDLAVRVRAKVEASKNIDWEEKADDARVKQLYARCHFTIYPSLEEGFGMPILESLWYGKPAICANFGAMHEVGEGGGCVTVDVTDVEAMAEAIVSIANTPGKLASLIEEAKIRQFRSWRDYTQDVAEKLSLHIIPTENDAPSQALQRSIG
jgi:glycosyltransferase involved in cell wall biosynthesis